MHVVCHADGDLQACRKVHADNKRGAANRIDDRPVLLSACSLPCAWFPAPTLPVQWVCEPIQYPESPDSVQVLLEEPLSR